jgi:hypothetical protein
MTGSTAEDDLVAVESGNRSEVVNPGSPCRVGVMHRPLDARPPHGQRDYNASDAVTITSFVFSRSVAAKRLPVSHCRKIVVLDAGEEDQSGLASLRSFSSRLRRFSRPVLA